ncbi:MAG: hypothetical protein ACM3Q1_18080 [Bacteroidales bacterium]
MGLLAALTRRAAPRSEPVCAAPILVPTPRAPMAKAGALPPPAAMAPAPILALPPPREKRPRHDLRHISPRRFAEITHELYVEGSLKWAEYQLVGFPSELHPHYDSTIGALTGQKAEPNRPRDLLAEWENRVDFMRRYGDPGLSVAERALDVLRRQAEPRA